MNGVSGEDGKKSKVMPTHSMYGIFTYIDGQFHFFFMETCRKINQSH